MGNPLRLTGSPSFSPITSVGSTNAATKNGKTVGDAATVDPSKFKREGSSHLPTEPQSHTQALREGKPDLQSFGGDFSALEGFNSLNQEQTELLSLLTSLEGVLDPADFDKLLQNLGEAIDNGSENPESLTDALQNLACDYQMEIESTTGQCLDDLLEPSSESTGSEPIEPQTEVEQASESEQPEIEDAPESDDDLFSEALEEIAPETAEVITEVEATETSDVSETSESPGELSDQDLEATAERLGIPPADFKAFYQELRAESFEIGLKADNVNLGNMMRNFTEMVSGGYSEDKGAHFTGSQAGIRRLRATTEFLMNAQMLGIAARNNPDSQIGKVAGKLKLDQISVKVQAGIDKIPNAGVRDILKRYTAPQNRAEMANALQRVGDLESLLNLSFGNEKFDMNVHPRAMFELALDNGTDAVKALRELMPANIQAKFDAVGDKIENKLTTLIAKHGAQAPKLLRELITSAPQGAEMARYAARFLTDDGVGMVAHTIDILREASESPLIKNNLGEKGAQALKSLTSFLELDNIAQNQIRSLISSSASLGEKAQAFKGLATHFAAKLPTVPVSEIRDAVVDNAQRAFNYTGEALSQIRTQVEVGLKMGIDDAAVVAQKAVDAVNGKIDDLAKKLKLNPKSVEKLKKMVTNLGPEGVKNLLGMAERAGSQFAGLMIDTFDSLGSKVTKTIANNPAVGNMVVDTIKGAGQALKKLGVPAAHMAPKLGKNLLKIIPALGGAVSAYDAARLGSIALIGKDLAGKEYKDPNVRALALLGSVVNTADTALAVTEALGIGNVAMPAQIGLAGAGLVLDLAVEYYNDNPMPEGMAKTIRRGAALAAGGGLLAAPITGGASLAFSGALANIYGTDVLVDELKTMGREGAQALKELAVAGGELAMDALEGLSEMGSQYLSYVDSAVSDLMAKGGKALDSLMEKAGDVKALATRIGSIIYNKLSDGYEHSSFDINPFNNVDMDLGPLKDAVADLSEMAYNAGAKAASEIKGIVEQQLRDLGVPAWALDIVL